MPKRDDGIRRQYAETHTGCEVCDIPWWKVTQNDMWAQYGLQCHDETQGHILSGIVVHHTVGGHSRYDAAPNLIAVCGFYHAWMHDADPIAGRIVAWYAKHMASEFDADAISVIWGKRVAGWLEWDDVLARCRRSELLDEWRKTLLEASCRRT